MITEFEVCLRVKSSANAESLFNLLNKLKWNVTHISSSGSCVICRKFLTQRGMNAACTYTANKIKALEESHEK